MPTVMYGLVCALVSTIAMSWVAKQSQVELPAGTHWTTQHALRFPGRVAAGLMAFVLPLFCAMFGAIIIASPLQYGGALGMALVGAVVSLVASTPWRVSIERRSVPMTLAEYGRGVVVRFLFFFWPVFVLPVMWAITGDAIDYRMGVAALVGVLMCAAFIGGVGRPIGQALGVLLPADERLARLVRRAAIKSGVTPRATYLLRWPTHNAFALPFPMHVGVTERTMESFEDHEVSAILHHELGHLAESAKRKWSRLLPLVFLLPLGLVVPLNARFGPGAVLGFVWSLLIILFFVKRRRVTTAEEEADAHAHEHEEDEGVYAKTLEALYQRNGMPAVLAQTRAHPNLYDRMVDSGVTPDYPRPSPAKRRKWVLEVVPIVFVVLSLSAYCLGASMLGSVSEELDDPAFAFAAPSPNDMGYLGANTLETDPERAIVMLEMAAKERPDWQYSLWLAHANARAGHCDEARREAAEAAVLLQESQPQVMHAEGPPEDWWMHEASQAAWDAIDLCVAARDQ